jgi:hypothetical protein
MKEYNIKYLNNKYMVFILFPIFLIVEAIICIFVIKNRYIYKFMENHTILSIIIFMAFLIFSLFLILNYGLKMVTKNIHLKIFPDYIEINNGIENINFNTITKLELETLSGKKYIHSTTGYVLRIKHGSNKYFTIAILTGTSKDEEANVNNLLEFYEEINKKYYGLKI